MDQNFLSDQGFSLIDPTLISRYMSLVETEPTISAAADFRINDILAGNIVFTLGTSPDPLRGAEWDRTSRHWHDVSRRTVRQLLALGFTAAVTEGDRGLDERLRMEEYGPSVDRTKQRGRPENRRLVQMRNKGPMEGWETGMGPSSSRRLDARDMHKGRDEDLLVHVLDLSKIDVYWRKDVFSQQSFRFFVRDNAQGIMGDHKAAFKGDHAMHQREIHHVFWFVTHDPVLQDDYASYREALIRRTDRYPNGAGMGVKLTSPIARLTGVMDLTRHNLACHKVGTMLMTNPTILLQDQPKAVDPNESGSMGLNVAAHGPGEGSAGQLENSAQLHSTFPARNFMLEEQERRFYESQALRREEGSSSKVAAPWGSSTGPETIEITVGETTVAEMPAGKAVIRQNPAQAVPYMMELLQLEKERVWEVMGIPLAVQLDINPSKKSSLSVGEKGGAMHENRDSRASEAFQQLQRGLREQLTHYCQVIIDYVTLYHRTLAKSLSIAPATSPLNKKQKKNTTTEKKTEKKGEEHEIHILLPGQPSPETVIDLFKMGIVKYDYLPPTISRSWDIPLNAFVKEPQLDLLQLNGIDPPDADDPSEAGKLLSSLSQKKNKGKKKTSSSSSSKKRKK